jgi:hypothetical protein
METVLLTDTVSAYPQEFRGHTNAIDQAEAYGAQVAQLSLMGLEEDAVRIRKAYLAFSNQFVDENVRRLIVDAYWKEYGFFKHTIPNLKK